MQTFAEQALDLARIANDRMYIAWSLADLGYCGEEEISYERAEALLEESVALFREIEDPMGLNHTLLRLAHIVVIQGDYAYGRTLLEEALEGIREVGDKIAMYHVFLFICETSLRQHNDVQQAAKMFESALSLTPELHNSASRSLRT